MTKLSGWGRYPARETELCVPRDANAVTALLGAGPVIARGNGRAYGDSAVGLRTISTRHLNRLLDFDPNTGVLAAESGVILGDIIQGLLPRGWFPPVTPGTKFVTLGGMIAADVHGKNHHVNGTFGNFIDWIDLLGETGAVTRCSKTDNPELFAHTIGGMGLTGIILAAGIRMRPVPSGWIRQKLIATPDLASTLAAFEQANEATYSVAWIDCLARGARQGRSLLMLGEHATLDDLPPGRAAAPYRTPKKRTRRVPFNLPSGLLNQTTVTAFNRLYYAMQSRKKGVQIIDWDSYFYPLDSILGWNRIYGRKGFVQFQCVLPPETSEAGLRKLLGLTARAGMGSFLAVLKRLGAQESRFSFPMEGYTLALDFPMTPHTERLMKKLDRVTIEHGGRFYLAKDARMSADMLQASDARAAAFRAWRAGQGKTGGFASAQSERLGL
ncbi:MAG: FAD-binding oxidoreductase [Pseudomonadota bacterium]